MAQSFRLPLSGREQKRPFLTAQTPRGKHEGDSKDQVTALLPSLSWWSCLASPHMLLPTVQLAPDRFSAPMASISFNSLGEVLGNTVLHVVCLRICCL